MDYGIICAQFGRLHDIRARDDRINHCGCVKSVTDEISVGTDEWKGGDVPVTIYTAGTETMEGDVKRDSGFCYGNK